MSSATGDLLTEAEALAALCAKAKEITQKVLAKDLEISPGYLNDVILGKRDPAHVLRRFGYKRVVHYLKVEEQQDG